MENTDIFIRPMESTDNEAVADLIEEWRDFEALNLRQHYDRYTLDAVAECAGRIVGWISYKIKDCNPDVLAEYEDSAEDWLYVVEVYASPSERRGGIGQALMRYVEAEGRAAGVRHSVLMPEADHRTAHGLDQGIYEFYRALGYDLMKPSPKHQGAVAPWLMGLRL
ncbi:GNAT family N-acetyltransferase [Paeniglutamicibacter gangotriensis]|uniref:GNAT family N-acetyltransferase n=1 Tax=Paeniglutamicibacter gangotriensis TaxID=254787 RepID=UPI0037C8E0B9